ncbi:hypothetical protein SAMN05444411_110129 [Lutibacter oricola]|uniref:Membrane domain of glycerophosphoryl diester phosphodiesterase n=1 Tax=Lutibacter oricola TaxID=762486 RepID=A0A1H3F5I0_9FLAO|nr:hypothetical protein [Lutibacter oricola]SDX86165.1 hypothetical protein SAMN05444411_110129 [Lutibacter oricola]
MDNNSFIQFKRERDLGTIISDTFKFIRENWKEYFLTILKIVGPILAVSLAFIVFYMLAFSNIFSDKESIQNNPMGAISTMFSWVAGIIFVYTVLYTLLSMSSLYFIKSYIKNNGKPVFAEVKENVFKNIWKFLGLGILVTISVMFGMMLCYAPGIYLAVALSLSTSIMIFEDKNVGDSFSHSFTLIKGQWWNTFGVLIVVWLLIMVLGQVFSVPAFIYQMVQMGTIENDNDPTAVFSLFKDPIYLTLTIAGYLFQFILYSIPLISAVFIYFDLNEQKNLTGTFERIDNLGNSNNE